MLMETTLYLRQINTAISQYVKLKLSYKVFYKAFLQSLFIIEAFL